VDSGGDEQKEGTTLVETSRGQGAGSLLQLLRDGEPRGRSELAGLSGLSRSTVGLRLETLFELGFIAPTAETTWTGGRPSSKVALNRAVRVVAGVDLGAMHATVALTDLTGKFLAETTTKLAIVAGPETVLGWVADTIENLLEEIGRDAEGLAAIGIGVPGPVEHQTGKPSNPPIMPGWDRFDIRAWMNRSYNVPVLVDNDVNIMALGEKVTSWPNADHLILIKIATGIGAGVISGGSLQRGAEGIAGDVGHVSISRAAGVQCSCGNTGCLEAVAGAPAILASLASLGTDVETVTELIALVKARDINALQVVRQAGRDVGEMVNMCLSIVNPSVVVIGGVMSDAGEHLLAGIREVVYARSMPLATQNLLICLSQTGRRSAAIGASILAIDHVLSVANIDDLASRRIGAPAVAI